MSAAMHMLTSTHLPASPRSSAPSAHPARSVLSCFAFFAAFAFHLLPAHAQLAVRAKALMTMGPQGTIQNGVVVITDGKIASIGPAESTPIPDGYRVLDAISVTPGLIDARCTVGVSGIYNTRHDSDQLERSAPIQPELRAIDAYNPLDPLVEYVRGFGITTVHTGHAPGELVSGQTAIFKTVGTTVEDAVLVPEAMIATTLDPSAEKDGGKSPGTRAKMVAMLREQLIKAQEYAAKRTKPAKEASPSDDAQDAGGASPARDLRLEYLARVLDRELPLLVTANRAQDIASVLRLAREFNIRIVLDSASEAPMMLEELKDAKIDVIVHPTMARAVGDMENKSFTTAARLREAGLRVAIQGGYESYVPKARVVLFEASVASAHGMSTADTLASITIEPARILGIDARVGSLEVGKDADVVLFDGPDPLEYTTKVVGVVVDGKVVSEAAR